MHQGSFEVNLGAVRVTWAVSGPVHLGAFRVHLSAFRVHLGALRVYLGSLRVH